MGQFNFFIKKYSQVKVVQIGKHVFVSLCIKARIFLVYLTGFIMTEFLIFYKGLAGLLSLQIGDGYFLTLTLGSLLIPVSILLILIANKKVNKT